MDNAKEIWNELIELGLIDVDTSNGPDLLAWLDGSRNALEGFWQTDPSEYIANMSADELLHLPFNSAQKAVTQFSMKKRLDMLDSLNSLRDHYYDQTSRFGENVPKEEQISPIEFRALLGKIKHIEIVQNWLYGIV